MGNQSNFRRWQLLSSPTKWIYRLAQCVEEDARQCETEKFLGTNSSNGILAGCSLMLG